MVQFIPQPHWSLRGVTPIRGSEVEVYYHGTLRDYHDAVVSARGRYEPSETSASAYINLTRSWPEAISYGIIRNEQYGSQNIPSLLIISPEKVKRALVPNTGRRLYAHYLERDMYEILDIDFSGKGLWGQPAPSNEWKKELETIVIELLGLDV